MAVVVRRFRKRSDFLALKARGQRVLTPAFVMQWQELAEEPGVAVGFTTSKALGGAVQRNRARRRLKAAFDAACRLNPEAQGQARGLVIVGKMPVFTIDFKYLVKDMARALREAGVTC